MPAAGATEEKMTDLSSFATLGSRPVPGDSPAGGDARYEPEYAAVLEEIEKLSFSGPGQGISWSVVETNAAAVLAGRSKDLQIAAYLGVALWQSSGLEGMLVGIRILADMLATYWETAWPALKRARGRVNAVNWWHERTYAFMKDPATQALRVSPELGKNLEGELDRLDGLITSLMPDAAPLSNLKAAVRQLSAQPPAGSPDKEAAGPAARAADAAAAQPVLSAAGSLPDFAGSGEGDLPRLRHNFVAAARDYLPTALRAEPTDAPLWQLSRLVAWGAVTEIPASESGSTQLPAPDAEALAQAGLQLKAGNALEAALTAEAFFASAPFCLDAQEVIHKALSSLGPRFDAAAQSIPDMAAAFIRRFPGVEKLSFINGTPFASPQTLIWLRAASASRGEQQDGDTRPTNAGACESVFASARDLASRDKLVEALAVVDDAKKQSPATNLRLTVCQARLLCEAGKTDAAGFLAEAILRETTARDLDDWDPESALEALLAVRDAFVLSGGRYEEPLRDVRRRIARLRPASALE
jgi:type VI secretion system protein VasJ